MFELDSKNGCIIACTSAGKGRGGNKSPVLFARLMFNPKRKTFLFFVFFIVNASLFPPPALLINKRKGKPSFGFIDAFSLAWILLCGKEQEEGKATGLICSFKEDKSSGFGNQSVVTWRPSRCTSVCVVSCTRFCCLLSSSPLSESLHHINQRLHAIKRQELTYRSPSMLIWRGSAEEARENSPRATKLWLNTKLSIANEDRVFARLKIYSPSSSFT